MFVDTLINQLRYHSYRIEYLRADNPPIHAVNISVSIESGDLPAKISIRAIKLIRARRHKAIELMAFV